VISNLGYEPEHSGVREKNLIMEEIPSLSSLFTVAKYKFEITATILITKILLT
jgi:hypothetical protein